jgi:hypothetical protein
MTLVVASCYGSTSVDVLRIAMLPNRKFSFCINFSNSDIWSCVSAVFNLCTNGETLWPPERGIQICWGQGCNDVRNPFSFIQTTITLRVLVASYFVLNLYLNMLTFVLYVLKEKVFHFIHPAYVLWMLLYKIHTNVTLGHNVSYATITECRSQHTACCMTSWNVRPIESVKVNYYLSEKEVYQFQISKNSVFCDRYECIVFTV